MAPEHEAGRLYDAHGAALYRYALMILGRHDAAEDAIQHVFTALAGSGPRRLDNEEHYLRRAVRNACYSLLRARVRGHRQALERSIVDPVAGSPPLPEEHRIALADALRALAPEQREVVHLHFFEGRTFREIAELTDASINTVMSRCRYAIDKLKHALAELPR